jgi:SWI/SNF-related matrix-associated actin-dependent regulator 1 of chromatin subfamily A
MLNSKVSQNSRLELVGDSIQLFSPYHADLVRDMRGIEGRRWNSVEKCNLFPTTAVGDVLELAAKWDIPVPTDVSSLPPLVEEVIPDWGLEVDDSSVMVRFPYDPEVALDIKRSVPGSRWDSARGVWKTSITNIDDAFKFAMRHGLSVEPTVAREVELERRRADSLHRASSALDADLDVPGMALGMELLPYQRAGVRYALEARRLLIADEMGLGKSVMALTAAVMGHALPLVVVCGNTMKSIWAEEVEKFFPQLTTTVVSGGAEAPIDSADVVIINYDVVDQRSNDLIRLEPNSLVLDESHRIKNSKAKYHCPFCNLKCRVNTKRCASCYEKFDKPVESWTVRRGAGCMKMARAIPESGMVMLLSGTPITNRPAELIPQLIAIDRIDAFGGRWGFMSRYAPNGTGAANLIELNRKMRETCLIRRTKQQVWEELPDLRSVKRKMEPSKDLWDRYKEIERDVVHFLADRARLIAEEAGEDGDRAYVEKAMRAEAAEHLVRISVLKSAVVDLKVESMVQWIKDFLEDSDEKLIVFGEHIDLVERIYAEFEDIAVKVRGGVSQEDRMAAVHQFQENPEIRLFVANMEAASEGLTLTKSSNIAFLELGWTPAIHDQCASRCYGRANDVHGATAYYLVADDTIDSDIYSLLGKKRVVINAATDGREVEKQGSLLSDLVWNLSQRQAA